MQKVFHIFTVGEKIVVLSQTRTVTILHVLIVYYTLQQLICHHHSAQIILSIVCLPTF